MSDVLRAVQRGLEALYRVQIGLDVTDFLVDSNARAQLSSALHTPEQLLVLEASNELELALFIDEAVLLRLEQGLRAAPALLARSDLLLAIEGVSHFLYAVWCAKHARRVSTLELEFQGEVDKFVTCLLAAEPDVTHARALRQALFVDAALLEGLSPAEAERYVVANENANRYARHLEQAYVREQRIDDMLIELRRFYRADLPAKLASAARLRAA